jgi:hypothetical protein
MADRSPTHPYRCTTVSSQRGDGVIGNAVTHLIAGPGLFRKYGLIRSGLIIAGTATQAVLAGQVPFDCSRLLTSPMLLPRWRSDNGMFLTIGYLFVSRPLKMSKNSRVKEWQLEHPQAYPA